MYRLQHVTAMIDLGYTDSCSLVSQTVKVFNQAKIKFVIYNTFSVSNVFQICSTLKRLLLSQKASGATLLTDVGKAARCTSILAVRCLCGGTYGHAGYRLAHTTDVTPTVNSHQSSAMTVYIYSTLAQSIFVLRAKCLSLEKQAETERVLCFFQQGLQCRCLVLSLYLGLNMLCLKQSNK